MRISKMTTQCVDLPLETVVRTPMHDIASVSCLLVRLSTDEGLEGEGLAFCFGKERLRVLDAMVKALSPQVVGADAFMTDAIWNAMFRSLNFFGQAGIAVMAMAPIDIACWDIVGKAVGQPLHRLFGGHRTRVPLYASGGLFLSSGPDDLVREAEGFLDQGFKAMKLRLGALPVAKNMERVEAVRAAIGPDTCLMVDVNQGLSVSEAIRLGRALEPYGLTWYEEPIPTYDHHGHAEIARVLDTPLASGETEYLRFGMAHMIECQSADILMPDLQRMGGFTEFRRVIGQMQAAGVPFSPHLFTEHSLHLVAEGCLFLEHMPWFSPLFRERIEIDADGMVALPDRVGVGFTFDFDAIEPYLF